MTREEAAADGLDVDSTGFHLPTPAVDAAARVEIAAAGLDSGAASSDEESDAESDAESDVGSDSGGVLDCDDAQPVDLNELQRKLTGDSSHASIRFRDASVKFHGDCPHSAAR